MSTRPIGLLIVEDEAITALDLRLIVTRLGHVVLDTVASGEAAMQHVETCRPDLVLMDIGLQGAMDGIAAAARIWAEWHIPSIFITAYTDTRTLSDAGPIQSWGHIGKPLDAQEVESALKHACARLQVNNSDLR
jgi:CheY-like chemotaxis protein